MSLKYQEYKRNILKGEPKRIYIDQWRVDYLAFSKEKHKNRTPLVVLGGAFQNFNSYKFCVERILEDFPVILVDLPSLGNNDQLAPQLGMEDLSDLLHEFVTSMNLPKISLMGLSLGSVVSSTFAYKHPTLIEKLIVTGIIPKPRKSWRMLLEESVRVLDELRMKEFGQAVVLYLVNYNRLEETEISTTTRRLFQRQMRNFSKSEQDRYKINAARLLEVEGILGYPDCETLVSTGEYDSFTLPFENASFAAKCSNATFALIENADHLPQLERRDESLELFSAFLRGADLHAVDGIRVIKKADYENLERRNDIRYIPCNTRGVVTSESMIGKSFAFNQQVKVVDINYFGCLLQLESPGPSLAEHARDLTLQMESPSLELELLVFEHNESGEIRCLFKHGNIKKAEQFSAWLKNAELFIKPSLENGQKIRKIY